MKSKINTSDYLLHIERLIDDVYVSFNDEWAVGIQPIEVSIKNMLIIL